MQVILLERIPRLGQMGDEVRVKAGFARNYLLPQGKALRANEANRARFEERRVDLEAHNLERKTEASAVKEKLDGNSYVVIRSAGENGQLYGSVSTRDIADVLDENGFKLARTQVNLNMPIKALGLHHVIISLHPEVDSSITVNVARSADEAERQARGEDPTGAGPIADDEAAEIDLAEVFENPEEVELDEAEDTAEVQESAGSAEAGEDERADKPAG
jgi:large subunit ribosomal protein L9